MKVVLIQTPVWGIYEPPFALSLLSGCLKADGHEVTPFDLNIDLYNRRLEKYSSAWAVEQCILWTDENFVDNYFEDNKVIINKYADDILSMKPDVVGFSVNGASKITSLKFARLLKEKNNQIKIIFGGHLFIVPEDNEIGYVINSSLVDFIVYSEGETTFSELLKFIENKKDFSKCDGIIFRDTSGNTKKTSVRPLITDLDSLPFMDFSGLPLERYEHPDWLGNHLTIQASRGCLWKCAFCAATTYWKGYRCMSGRRIYEEVKYHISHHPEIEHIEFMDLLFNGKMKTMEEFCDCMINDPPRRDLKWHANAIIRPEMTPEVLAKMKKAGCLRLTFGIESGSQKVLDLMKKNYKIADAGKVLKAAHDAGILIKANFMFGFPGETEEDFQMTLNFLRDNAGYIDTAYPSFSFCVVENQSYLGQNMDEFGIIANKSDNLYWESKDGSNTYPERLRRWEVFSDYARSCGVAIGIGLNTSLEQHRWMNLGYYYKSKKDYKKSLECFEKYLELDPDNKAILNEISQL